MPKTILYLTPSSRLLGARRSLLQLVTNLDPARYRPVVVVQGPGDLVDALNAAGVPVRTLFLGWWRKGRYILQRPLKIWQLARLAKKEGASLIHCNEFYPNPYAVRAARRAHVPVITHMRLSITPRQIDNYSLRDASRILCVSQAAARDFDVWPDARERVEVIYNGVDFDEFRPKLSREEARTKLGLLPDDFVVGQFGLLSSRKRAHMLLEAAAILRDRLPQLRILIVGSAGRSDGPYEQQLHEIIASQNLGSIVTFIPFTPDVVDIYQACDANTLISNDEGFGRTIIEAGALSVPSIGARVGGIPELIEENKTGLLIPAEDDASALASAIEELATAPDHGRAMGTAAHTHVKNSFSIQSHVRQVMDVYDRVLGGR